MDWVLWLFMQALKLMGLCAVTVGAMLLIARLAQRAERYIQFDEDASRLARLFSTLRFVLRVTPVACVVLLAVAALWWWAFF